MRWTEQQAADHQRRVKAPAGVRLKYEVPIAAAKKSKFRNIRCEAKDGTRFASKLERDYYENLLLRWKAGEVLYFVRQPSFDLEGGVIYRADFLVVSRKFCSLNVEVDVIDCKGFLTAACKNKIKQVEARYHLKVQLVKKA